MLMKMLTYLAATMTMLGTVSVTPTAAQRIVGTYTSWSVYGRDYHVQDIPAEKVDVISYAFARIEDGRIALGDPYADTELWYEGDSWHPDSLRGCFHQLQLLKQRDPQIEILISVGGWTWSAGFSDAALTEESRAIFAESCVDFVQEYRFDGVEIDWEFPVSGGDPGNTTRPEDKENFTLLLAELRSQLDQAGDYRLAIAATASPFLIDNVEVDAVQVYLDWIDVMSYDFHGPWEGEGDIVTNFNSPLYPADDDPLDEPFHSEFNLAAAIDAYELRGVAPQKLNAGLAFYGRGYGEVVADMDGLYAPYSGPSGQGTWEPGVFDYWDLAENYVGEPSFETHRHDQALVPWLYNPASQIVISYDDPESIAEKGRFVVAAGLGGAMFWEFGADRQGTLLSALYEAVTDSSLAGAGGVLADRTTTLVHVMPNPARGSVRFERQSPLEGRLTVRIFDAQGRIVKEVRSTMGMVVWDGLDRQGAMVPSGVYFYEAELGLHRARGRFLQIN